MNLNSSCSFVCRSVAVKPTWLWTVCLMLLEHSPSLSQCWVALPTSVWVLLQVRKALEPVCIIYIKLTVLFWVGLRVKPVVWCHRWALLCQCRFLWICPQIFQRNIVDHLVAFKAHYSLKNNNFSLFMRKSDYLSRKQAMKYMYHR